MKIRCDNSHKCLEQYLAYSVNYCYFQHHFPYWPYFISLETLCSYPNQGFAHSSWNSPSLYLWPSWPSFPISLYAKTCTNVPSSGKPFLTFILGEHSSPLWLPRKKSLRQRHMFFPFGWTFSKEVQSQGRGSEENERQALKERDSKCKGVYYSDGLASCQAHCSFTHCIFQESR